MIEKSISQQNTSVRSNLSRARIPIACACLSCASSSVVATERLSRVRKSASVAHAVPYHDKLATRAVSVSCHDTDELHSDLLTMTKLCRDLKFSCRHLVFTAYTSLCYDTEKSCCDIKLLIASALYRNIEKICRDMGFSFMPVLYRNLKAYIATEKSSRHYNLCRDTKRPVATLNLLNLGNTLSQHKILCRDIKSLHYCQLYCDIETFYQDTTP